MDRHGQHIVAVIENALRTVAVMHIDIQNCGAQATGAQPLCGDPGVVEKAEPPRQIAVSMMPRRAAERIARTRAIRQKIGPGHGGLRRPIGRFPRALADRTGGIGLMKPRLPDGGLGIIVGSVGGMNIRDHLLTGALDPLPAGVDILEKRHIFRRMQRRDRAKPGILRRDEITARRLGTVAQAGDPLWLFGAGQNLAIGHEMFRIMVPLAVVKNGLHCAFLISRCIASCGRRIVVALLCGSNPRRV